MVELPRKPVKKEEWGSTHLEPWFPNTTEKTGEMWFESPNEGPLLIKFLFTTAALSVQVHPNDEYARLNPPPDVKNPRGKTEMWHILRAEPGAKIAAGFREAITAEQLRASAVSGKIENLLEWHDARPGDTFFIPAGTVHAIGGGLTLCEIQQTSDITYRLYDYNRGRELHLDHGVRVSHLGPHSARTKSREGVLVTCPHFTTEKIVVRGTASIAALDKDQTLIVIEGSGEISGLSAGAGQVFQLPAGESANISGNISLLRTFA